MSWVEKLNKTYENNKANIADPLDREVPLLPLYHTTQKAQLQVVVDINGNLVATSSKAVAPDDAQTIVPATEESAGRSGAQIAPHPLCDTLQYVAGDYLKYGGNPKKKNNVAGYQEYMTGLGKWCAWSNNQKLRALHAYLKKGTLIQDLVMNKILWADTAGNLLEKWEGKEQPEIFKAIRKAQKKGQFESFVRFSVFVSGDPQTDLWTDLEIRKSWMEYYPTIHEGRGFCMVEGKDMPVSFNHPKNIRHPGDGAKLVSSNDEEGFTFLGRFSSAEEVYGLGIETTQKAHNALRWLIKRQGWHNSDQVVVAWAVNGADIPDPWLDTASLFGKINLEPTKVVSPNTAQEVGTTLSKMLSGYSAKLGNTDEVVVLGLDSASPGRMAITFYRELTGSELLDRVKTWHGECCWLQKYGKDKIFVGAPSPRDIAETAYGKRIDDNLRKATVQRLLPCIVDGVKIPRDLVDSCVRRASNRNGLETWEWEKALGIACALFRYQHTERRYDMVLEKERKSRDYLYGRLLAVAERMENYALYIGGEKRETNAGKLMQRFADHPFSTWKTIETSLTPYKQRLMAKKPAVLHFLATELDQIMDSFRHEDFISDKALSGEFLLGYHCQRQELHPKDKSIQSEDGGSQETQETPNE